MESRSGGESSRGYSYGESRGYYSGESRGSYSQPTRSTFRQEVKPTSTGIDSTSTSNITNSRIEQLRAQHEQFQREIDIEEERKRLEQQEEERLLELIREDKAKLKELRNR